MSDPTPQELYFVCFADHSRALIDRVFHTFAQAERCLKTLERACSNSSENALDPNFVLGPNEWLSYHVGDLKTWVRGAAIIRHDAGYVNHVQTLMHFACSTGFQKPNITRIL